MSREKLKAIMLHVVDDKYGPDSAEACMARELFDTPSTPSAENRPAQDDVRDAAWFAVAMNAAAYIETAASSLIDPDAKKAAEGAAEHVRRATQKLWSAAIASQSAKEPVDEFFAEPDAYARGYFKGKEFGERQALERAAQDDVRDAQRYRWLSGKHGLGKENLDEQIDAAIASQSAKEPL